MNRPRIRLLLLEHSVADAKATLSLLKMGGVPVEPRVTSSREGFVRELKMFKPEIILADHDLPGFNGEEALDLVRRDDPTLPFVLLSGSTGQEEAVALVRKGATEFVRKDTLEQLPQAVKKALRAGRDRTESARLESENRNVEKLEAMGRVAAGVAHDFNNILTIISGSAELGLESVDPGHPAHAHLSEIRRSAQRASELTQRLLVFSRRRVAEPVALDPGQTIRKLSGMLASLVGDTVELKLDLDTEKSATLVDPASLEHSVVNLVLNAREAMPKGGTVRLRTFTMNVTEQDSARHADWKPGWYVVLEVSDNGAGMHPEAMARIFEPFFTTKDRSKGAGLGLPMVYGFAKQHGGHVEVSSTPGRGSTFQVFLPRTDRPTRMVTSTRGMPAMAPPDTTILVAEDERSIRMMVRASLAQVGYEVLEAPDGAAALDVAKAHPGRIDVLLTDWVMPRMRGPDLAHRIRLLHPGVKVLVMSGYVEEEIRDDSWRAFAHGFIEKPFKLGSLRRRVRELLETN